MKSIHNLSLRLLAFVVAAALGCGAHAQARLKRMATNYLFEKAARPHSSLMETHIEGGKNMAQYNLTVFRCVQGQLTQGEFSQLEKALDDDMKTAAAREVRREKNRTHFMFLQFPFTQGGQLNYSYLVFQRKGERGFVCAYLEGTATAEELRKNFEHL